MSSDSEIIRDAIANPASFAMIYDRHAARVYSFVSRRIGSGAADDLMSETFLVAFERRERFDTSIDDARPWLFGIATTLMKRHRRLEARALARIEPTVSLFMEADVDERLDAESAAKRMGKALTTLPSGDRDALLLYAWADLDYGGVAQALGIPIGTVRSRLNRARRKLRHALERGAMPGEEVSHGRAAAAEGRA